MKRILIAAMAANNVIGRNGKIPWHSKEEINHFKKTTSGFAVILGRKTLDAIGAPLSNRINIVVTRNKMFKIESEKTVVFDSLESAFNYCDQSGFEKVFIIGGGEIFRQTIDEADEIILSQMNFQTDGDVYFPEIDTNRWKEKYSQKFTDFAVHYYIRNQF